MITQTENIKINGHKGTWYEIDSCILYGKKILLLEHETYGDEATWLVVSARNGKVLSDECFDYETFYEVVEEYKYKPFLL